MLAFYVGKLSIFSKIFLFVIWPTCLLGTTDRAFIINSYPKLITGYNFGFGIAQITLFRLANCIYQKMHLRIGRGLQWGNTGTFQSIKKNYVKSDVIFKGSILSNNFSKNSNFNFLLNFHQNFKNFRKNSPAIFGPKGKLLMQGF